MKKIILICALALGFLPAPLIEAQRGSLVVVMVSVKGDYVVVAADSRNSDVLRGKNMSNDKACKVISLGGDTMFFETGASFIGVLRGTSWSARSAARVVYRESRERGAQKLSIAWGNKALKWFYGQAKEDLQSVADEDGGLVTGGFITFDDTGTPSVQNQTVFYTAALNSLTRRPDGQPPGLGQITIAGVAKDLVTEFVDGKTKRSVEAFGPVGAIRQICVDPTEDAKFARKAIQFAIDNSTGKERATLGDPVDVAIFRKTRTIEWVSRKPECYKQDQPALPTAPKTTTPM